MSVRPVPTPKEAPIAPMSDQEEKLVDIYRRYFTVVPADSDALREQVYRLRYQVLAVEHGYLDPADYPDGMERDEWDEQSVHMLLIHRATGRLAGTARVVLPYGAHEGLPVFHHCPRLRAVMPLMQSGEISRFSVSKEFRRRLTDSLQPDVYDARIGREGTHDMRRLVPHITLGLMEGCLRALVHHGMTHVCSVMEPQLVRLLTRFGIRFREVGPLVELFGLRQPCYRPVVEMMDDVRRDRPEVWDVICDEGRVWDEARG